MKYRKESTRDRGTLNSDEHFIYIHKDEALNQYITNYLLIESEAEYTLRNINLWNQLSAGK